MNRWVEGIHLAPSFYLKSDIRQARHRMQAYAVWLFKDPENQGGRKEEAKRAQVTPYFLIMKTSCF